MRRFHPGTSDDVLNFLLNTIQQMAKLYMSFQTFYRIPFYSHSAETARTGSYSGAIKIIFKDLVPKEPLGKNVDTPLCDISKGVFLNILYVSGCHNLTW